MIETAAPKGEKSHQERYLHMLLRYSPGLIAMTDRDGFLQYCTDSFARTIRVQNAELLEGVHYLEVLEHVRDEKLTKTMRDCFRRIQYKKTAVTETISIDLDQSGIVSHYRLAATAMLDADSNIEGYMIIFNDVTETVHAKEEAEAANSAKSEFLASMSHEVRTPLNAIMGLAEMEIRQDIPQRTRTNLEKIYNSGQVLLNIVNDILDISKIESGKITLIPIHYDPQSLIHDAVTMNVLRIGTKPITFKLRVDPALPALLIGDELRVKQILNNLLSNAIKYTDRGAVEMDLDTKLEGNQVEITVVIRDSGIGIPADGLEKIFEKYQQLDIRKHYSVEGTGLGLAITKRIVDLMGGSIHVESAYGQGSVFTVRFRQQIAKRTPIGEMAAKNLASMEFSHARSGPMKTLTCASLPHGKALVVDDVATNLDVIRGALMGYEMQIDTASGGQEAIDKVRAETVHYDMILMDHMMPRVDGEDALRAIRALPSDYARNLPVIVLTANALQGSEKKFKAAGFTDYLSKPIDIYRLDRIVRKYVGTGIHPKEGPACFDPASGADPGTSACSDPAPGADSGTSVCPALETESLRKLYDSCEIEGLDAKKGLGLYGGNVRGYNGSVLSFYRNIPDCMDALDPDGQTLDGFVTMIHGIKGSCYGICADGLGRMTESLEMAARAGNREEISKKYEDFTLAMSAFLTDLKGLIRESEALLSGTGEKPERGSPDPKQLEKMLEAVHRYDIEGLQEIMKELDSFRYQEGRQLVASLKESLENFDYEALRQKLAEYPGAQASGLPDRSGPGRVSGPCSDVRQT